MTTGPVSQCAACQRLRSPFEREGDQYGQGGPWCAAFPDGIPPEVYDNRRDHRQPVPGDHGLRWLAKANMEYPRVFFVEDQPDAVTAASTPDHGSDDGMVALVPASEWATTQAVDDGLPPGELHLTLAYLAQTPPADGQAAILAACEKLATQTGPVTAEAFAVALFNPHGDTPAIVLALTGGEITDLQATLTAALETAGIDLSGQHRPWIPHVTLTYTDDHYAAVDVLDRCGPVSFDRLRVAFADQVTDLPLGSTAAVSEEAAVTTPTPMECPPGQHMMPDGTCMDDDQMMPMTEPASEYQAMDNGTPWYACALVEGEWSGDGRQWAPGGLDWAGMLPQSLKWQPADAAYHDGAVTVGRVDGVMRQGPMIWTWGVFDDAGENGKEALRLVDGEFVTGVSISADDVEEQDVELICPEMPMMPGAPGMPEMGMMEAGCESPKEIIHRGRMRSLTLLTEPAFPQCRIHLGPPPPELGLVMTAAAVGSHSTPVSEATTWDAAANEKRLASPMAVSVGRQAYAWIDDSMVSDGQMPKEAGRFLHHDISSDGSPSGANMIACSAGIAVLNGGRGGTTVPDSDVQGIYNHLAAHLRDGDREPPALTASQTNVITAAGYTISIPQVWPESWFEPPAQPPPFGALHITDQGQVYGLLAPAGVNHRAFRASGQQVTAPRQIDYSEFMNKPALVADADGQVHRINAGNITFDCGHISPTDPRRADPAAALEHYDNSCSVAARVRVGENEHGTWVAGGLLHSVDADTVERMMACALSGDWQDGKLNAALLVPVEGFPRPVSGAVRIRDGAIVASSTPLVFVAAARPDSRAGLVLDRIARSVGWDAQSRLDGLKRRIDATRPPEGS